jgi:hypothetical protein
MWPLTRQHALVDKVEQTIQKLQKKALMLQRTTRHSKGR